MGKSPLRPSRKALLQGRIDALTKVLAGLADMNARLKSAGSDTSAVTNQITDIKAKINLLTKAMK